MLYILVSLFTSFIICLFIIRLNIAHDTYHGPQKFHKNPTPRIGGLAIYLAFLITGLLFLLEGKPFSKDFLMFVISGIPVFISGIAEDITKRISPRWRLIASFISGFLFFIFFNASINRVDIPLLDVIFGLYIFSVAFTVFAIAGVSHAFNIIDGFNGLAAGVAILIYCAYAYVSFLHNDYFLLYLSMTAIASTLGFFLWNYPFGQIFLGDGGAYFLGFTAASIGVLLISKYPDVSPWFVLMLVLYPVWETVFSIYRKRFLRGMSPSLPDSVHFHMLIYRRITKNLVGRDLNSLERNYYTTPFLWVMELLCFVPAVLFWKNTYILILFALGFIVIYTWLYFRIVKFKTPKILRIR